jgi:hypothetical protein
VGCLFNLVTIPFTSFSCLIALARNSKTMLNKNGEDGHPCLVLHFKGKCFIFYPFSMMLAICLSYIAFIMLRYRFAGVYNLVYLFKETAFRFIDSLYDFLNLNFVYFGPYFYYFSSASFGFGLFLFLFDFEMKHWVIYLRSFYVINI